MPKQQRKKLLVVGKPGPHEYWPSDEEKETFEIKQQLKWNILPNWGQKLPIVKNKDSIDKNDKSYICSSYSFHFLPVSKYNLLDFH